MFLAISSPKTCKNRLWCISLQCTIKVVQCNTNVISIKQININDHDRSKESDVLLPWNKTQSV